MKKKLRVPFLLITLMLVVLIAGCGTQEVNKTPDDQNKAVETGNLEIYCNLIESPKAGLISKDGWALSFDNIYMTIANIKAYQTDPPFEPGGDCEFNAVEEVSFDGIYNVDLAEGEDTMLIAKAKDVPVGHYNAISWENIKAKDGKTAGYSVVFVGQATKDGKTIDFNIKLDPEVRHLGGEYVGEVRKGFLQAGSTADLEITFHLNHFFGDNKIPADHKINTLRAVGFDLFAALAEGGKVNVDMSQLEKSITSEEYKRISDSLITLGHVGGAPTQKEKL